MKHYGDITKLSGWDLPVVDLITAGSPCQDVSQAGLRVGLSGERSGLFFEFIRIVKEMREHDRADGRPASLIRPRYIVFENVLGLFSKDGEDFRTVLEEISRICDPTATIPKPSGGWAKAGCIMGKGFSIAFRSVDAKFWGTPMRRKRLAVVADFDGASAPEILFERQNVSGSIAENGEEGQGYTKRAGNHTETESTREPLMLEMGSTKHTIVTDGICLTLKAKMGTGGGNVNAIIQNNDLRALTPCEIERLQGFPDNWTDIGAWTDTKGKLHKFSADSARYKALGNSIAVGYANNASGFWCWLLKRISAQYTRNATLGSLFDGIGGFPLAWEHYNGKGSAVWASEIEEFCIAVTKKHFGED